MATSGNVARVVLESADGNPGSTWFNAGDVVMGISDSDGPPDEASLSLDGSSRVEIGGALMLLSSSSVAIENGILIADRIDVLDGGAIQMGTESSVKFNRYDGDLFHDSGQISPGVDLGSSTIVGDYLQQIGASIEFEIGGPAGSYDQLTVQGSADLNGTIALRLVNGYTPDHADTFTVFAATNVIALFDNVSNGQRLTTIDGSGSFILNYGLGSPFASNQIVLSEFEAESGGLGDVNGDGAVNLLDVQPFVQAITDGIYVFEADINQDGSVNLLDVEPFVNLLTG